MTQKTFSFALSGGLDLVTPAATIKPGRCIAAKNYEPHDEGGYRRLQGYERFDGLPKPSDASYWMLGFDTGAIAAAEVDGQIRGQTSGATGLVGAVTVDSGSFAGGDAAGSLAIYEVVGTFVDDEPLTFTGADDGFSVGFSSGFG